MDQNAKAGPDFYDDDEVFATYARHRRSADSPNATLRLDGRDDFHTAATARALQHEKWAK